ncbi:MAG: response regulator [Candidatus Riflebacteria bacterium]|nr:response regulator [Candidatus Riflebacteria bacterium]
MLKGKFLSNWKVGHRLLFGFGVKIFFILLLGIFAQQEINKQSEIIDQFYLHPFLVTKSISEVKLDIGRITRNIRNFFLYGSPHPGVEALEQKVFDDELKLEISLNVVRDRFLGDPKEVKDVDLVFQDSKKVIDEVFKEIKAGEFEKAKAFFGEQENRFFQNFEKEVQDISDFAEKKTESFRLESVKAVEHSRNLMNSLLIGIVLLGLLITWLITQSIAKPIESICRHALEIASGAQTDEIIENRKDEIGDLLISLNQIIKADNQMIEQTREIAAGNFAFPVATRSEKDEIGKSIKKMTEFLKKAKDESDQRIWEISGKNRLSELLFGETKESEIGKKVVSFFCDYTGAKIGAIYIFDNSLKKLVLKGGVALPENREIGQEVPIGQGLVGETEIAKKSLLFENIPVDYLKVYSATGEASPQSLLMVPFLFKGELKGILELGYFKRDLKLEAKFLESCSDILSTAIQDAQYREKLEKLLNNVQKQAAQLAVQQNELQLQQNELQQTNEELEQNSEELRVSNEKLILQQKELAQSNEELRLSGELLEKQKGAVCERNIELENIRYAMEQKALELNKANRYKSEFLTKMSHELRTPLNSIMVLSRLLVDNFDGKLPPSDLESLVIINKSGNDLLNLINDILDLAKIEAGKIPLDISLVTPQELAQSVKSAFQPLFEEKKLEFEIKIDENFPKTIKTDGRRLEQIVRNFLSNAYKFTESGKVALHFYVPDMKSSDSSKIFGNKVEISVSDSGIGIPLDKHAKVFEVFEQLDSGIGRKYGGSGLGLSICRELAALLGGEIKLESTPGIGSRFILIIPEEFSERKTEILPIQVSEKRDPLKNSQVATLQQHSASQIHQEPFPDDRNSLRKSEKRILLIEDDANFARVLLKLCKERGFQTIVALHGEEGLVLTEKYLPDAIILDLILPGISGMEVLAKLKESESLRHIPVHVISGSEIVMEALLHGAIGCLKKPVKKEELDESFFKIEKLIQKKVKDLLIVDDDFESRKSIIQLIGNGDVKTWQASSVEEALEIMKNHEFDCIVLDILFPGMSGFDFLEKLKSDKFHNIPPIIVYTGKELNREDEVKLRLHADSIIIKGVRSSERLLDETSLFLHRVVENLPPTQKKMIHEIRGSDELFVNKKILLVDDDMRNLFALGKVFEKKKMIVIKAEDGKKALAQLEKNPDVSIILTDIMMPEMDGYETIRTVRNNPKFRKLPIIALTAKAMKEDRDKCIHAGASDYLSKPIEINKLLTMLRVWLFS